MCRKDADKLILVESRKSRSAYDQLIQILESSSLQLLAKLEPQDTERRKVPVFEISNANHAGDSKRAERSHEDLGEREAVLRSA